MKQILLGSLLAALCAASGPTLADGGTTRYVDNLTNCGGLTPCHRTIMEAVDAAVPLDTIEVFPGVYHETVTLFSKGQVVLRGRGEGAMPAIVAPAGADTIQIGNSVVQILGFILESPDAAAIKAFGAAAQVFIEGNLISAPLGIQFTKASGAIRNNTILGGGISGAGSAGCLVDGNTVIGGIGFSDWNGGPRYNSVLNNIVVGGQIGFDGRPTVGNVAAANVILGGGIRVNGYFCSSNQVTANVVRGGGIQTGFGAQENTIEGNFVSGSSADGILVNIPSLGGGGGNNSILRNTSVNNGGCDLNDSSDPRYPPNHWEANRYRTACGAAGSSAP